MRHTQSEHETSLVAVAADQSSFIQHDGLDDNNLMISKTIDAAARAKRCPWSHKFLDDMDLRLGECSRKNTRVKVEIALQRA